MEDKYNDDWACALKLLSRKVIKNTTTVTNEELGSPLLHIAKDYFKGLVPNVSKKASPSEDNTVPRVHTSPSILGCIIGYAGLFGDLHGVGRGIKFTGRYYLYHIPFYYALKPNKQLVYDADDTDEHWLITYNTATRVYKPSNISEVLFTKSVTSIVGGKGIEHDFEVLLDIRPKEGCIISDGLHVEKGYHSLVVSYDDNPNSKNCTYRIKSIEPITKSKYDVVRLEACGLDKPLPTTESYSTDIKKEHPAYYKWI